MVRERENKNSQTNYGTLVMRPYNIDGNEIGAFYDSSDDLVFILDNTINEKKPNVLLVINPDGDKKWDEILSNDYNVDLEMIRPKQDNKYQKLDIEYSGLNVYENLINAYNAGDDLAEHLNQLNILRDSAARHSAMMRLNAANEIISKTNVTIVKTKETIVKLQTRIKTLRAQLTATRKEIGKVPTKQSAARVLKLESQIEATNEKLKRAQKRLESAQKRLEMATVDAELASDVLNQPSTEIGVQKTKNKPVMVAPKYEMQPVEPETKELPDDEELTEPNEDNENEVKPLFDQDPQILNEDIAFQPIAFNAAVEEDEPESNNVPNLTENIFVAEEEKPQSQPVLETLTPVIEHDDYNKTVPNVMERPVLETLTPPSETQIVVETPVVQEPVLETMKPIEQPVETEPVEEQIPVVADDYKPVAPVVYTEPIKEDVHKIIETEKTEPKETKPAFLYYVLLVILIVLSVFTLWLYQKNIKLSTPVLTAKVEQSESFETPVVLKKQSKDVEKAIVETNDDTEGVFVDVVPTTKDVETESQTVQNENETVIATDTDVPPVVEDAVPSMMFVPKRDDTENEEFVGLSEQDVLAFKPVYEPGPKHDEMFIGAEDVMIDAENSDDVIYYEDENGFYDEEEAAYQAEQDELYYEE